MTTTNTITPEKHGLGDWNIKWSVVSEIDEDAVVIKYSTPMFTKFTPYFKEDMEFADEAISQVVQHILTEGV